VAVVVEVIGGVVGESKCYYFMIIEHTIDDGGEYIMDLNLND